MWMLKVSGQGDGQVSMSDSEGSLYRHNDGWAFLYTRL